MGNGLLSLYDASNTARVRFMSQGNSYITGGFLGIGTMGPATNLHIVDPAPQPQVIIENPAMGDAAENFRLGGIQDYTVGLSFDLQQGIENNFKICDVPFLTNGLGYTDPNTMFEIHSENPQTGIIDMNHQSRARVFQTIGQTIPMGLWQPVDFDMMTFDEHNEWMLAPVNSSPPGGPATSFFTALEEGYYQVNSRTDFNLLEHFPNYPGFVCIAIYVNGAMWAEGNKLQGADNAPIGSWNDLRNNLAPNVSDVVHLMPGDTVEIWVWQDLQPGMQLNAGSPDTYCSIHKIS